MVQDMSVCKRLVEIQWKSGSFFKIIFRIFRFLWSDFSRQFGSFSLSLPWKRHRSLGSWTLSH